MFIHFIRHGETSYKGIKDIEIWEAKEYMLSERGITQAMLLWEAFKNREIEFDSIVASSTPRAIQTAELIFPWKEITKVEAIKAKSSGIWEGKKKVDVYTEEYLNDVYSFVPPGGESYAMVNERATKWFYDFLKKNAHLQRVAVVSHDFAMKCLFCHFLDIPGSHIEDLKIDNVGQTIVHIQENGRIKLLKWNETLVNI